MKLNHIIRLGQAIEILTNLFVDTKSTEIADALDMLSAYREQSVEDNSQFGVGA